MGRGLAARIPITNIVTATGTVLDPKITRVDGLVTNLATAKVYLKFGANCSSADFSVVLAPCQAVDDGYGGAQALTDYVGQVSIWSSGTPRVAVTEILA